MVEDSNNSEWIYVVKSVSFDSKLFYTHPFTVNSEISRGFNFRETSHMRSFVKIKSSRIGGITPSFTYIGKSRPCRKFSTSKIGVLTLFERTKFSQKFPNLQY